MSRLRWLAPALLTLVALLGTARTAAADEANPTATLLAIVHEAEEGKEAAARGDAAAARHAYDEAHEQWEDVEDSLRARDAAGYLEVEAALDKVEAAVTAPTFSGPAAEAAFTALAREADEVADRIGGGTAEAAIGGATPADVLRSIGAGRAALERGDAAAAAEQIGVAVRSWPAAEGAVAARSQDAYHAIEEQLGIARAALSATPPDIARALGATEELTELLQPYAGGQSYSAFDVAAVLLREGLEALLVITALLAFLRKSGNADKGRWIWAGGAAGVAASLVVAYILQAIFSGALAGSSRELIEGGTGLFAAAMLFYVSYWLHSKSSMSAWKRYIDDQTARALARGSMAGLALLAFLAVFREGAETVVFYLGMAPSVSAGDLTLGLAAGLGVLTVAAVLMLVVGVRLPLRLFFQIAGLLVYYLGFKFVGTGIHSLQVAGVLPASPVLGLPSLPTAGIFATWETLVPQALLLAAAVGAVLYLRQRDRQTRRAAPATA